MKKSFFVTLIIIVSFFIVAALAIFSYNRANIDPILSEKGFFGELVPQSQSGVIGQEVFYNLTITDYHNYGTHEYRLLFDHNPSLNGEFYYDHPKDGSNQLAVVSSQAISVFLKSGKTSTTRLIVTSKNPNVNIGDYKFSIKINEVNSIKYQNIDGSLELLPVIIAVNN
ncbi:MAG: hypothetical protein AABW73_00295 [Nanoarchaeota archaeon]